MHFMLGRFSNNVTLFLSVTTLYFSLFSHRLFYLPVCQSIFINCQNVFLYAHGGYKGCMSCNSSVTKYALIIHVFRTLQFSIFRNNNKLKLFVVAYFVCFSVLVSCFHIYFDVKKHFWQILKL